MRYTIRIWQKVTKRAAKKRRSPRRRRRLRSNAEYELHKEAARALVHARLLHFNTHYKLAYKSVRIKDTKSRWGSCSKSGNLNFNYRLALIDPELADYVVVHELCHLREFHHGQRFWDLVAETLPDYPERRKKIRAIVIR